MLTAAPSWFRTGYPWSYIFLVRYLSWVWKFSYHLLDTQTIYQLVQPCRRAWNLFIVRPFVRQLTSHPPDLLLATHFLPADICDAGKRAGWLRAPVVVVVTDLHPHRFWMATSCDAMVVATPESARVCRARGMAMKKVHVLGIPISAAFSAPADRHALQTRLGLASDRHTVLVTSGSTTVGDFEHVVNALLALETPLPHQLQLLVVCGEDEAMQQRFSARARTSAMPLHVFGFVDNMAELMAVSDLAVAKAGGLTVSEALGRGLPLVLYHIIPGQERMNARYIAEHGAGVIAHSPPEVVEAVHRCVRHPEQLQRMREAAAQFSHPHAARDIMSQVVNPLLRTTRGRS